MKNPDSVYLCYDLKGIQTFIFSIPRLRYICGGSALVDIFDRQTVCSLSSEEGRLLFSGGGKGAYACTTEEVARRMMKKLVQAAHEAGLDICFGMDVDYNEASHQTIASFPYMPERLDGHPCPDSGLYPVVDGVHPVVKKRLEVRRHYEESLLEGVVLGGRSGEELEFFSNVSSNDAQEWDDGEAGSTTLGSRNRWAVICMDGNNMGDQHRDAVELFAGQPETYQAWLGAMSRHLDDSTRKACKHAIQTVVETWHSDSSRKKECSRNGALILPLRPLLVGGDDIVVLCHVDFAIQFVREVCQAFHEASVRLADEYREQTDTELWPASNEAGLTISAGVLFAPVGLPLSTAIGLAEQLQASAKQRGRMTGKVPVPACIDWESVTEGLVDSIHRRRQQDLLFMDGDLNLQISLTSRPCTLDEMKEIETLCEKYRDYPGTIRHQVLPAMQKARGDRSVFIERIRKHQRTLAEDLDESKGRWRNCENKKEEVARCTDVVDALLLLEESRRMTRKTAGEYE